MPTTMIVYLIHLGLQFILALCALVLYFRVVHQFRPIMLFLICIFVFEIFQAFFDPEHSLSVNADRLHYLAESLLIFWFAWRLDLFGKRPILYVLVPALVIVCWVLERFVFELAGPVSWSRILVSVVISWIAIRILTRGTAGPASPGSRYPLILISIALIFYYVLLGVGEVLLLLVDTPSQSLLGVIFYFFIVISVITNVVYFFSLLWIPKKSNLSLS